MNPFFHAILAQDPDLQDLTLRITSGQETVLNSLSWFNAYKASEFPEVVCDKDYFFLYSTDHDGAYTTIDETHGAIMWGKGNNPDLSDFVEVGEIIRGWQAETPLLVRVPSNEIPDTEILHLFYHTQNEPGNTVLQETRLITSVGGAELHLMNWTDRGRPLGVLSEESHTGYLMPYRRGANDWICTHITKSGLPQPWFYSTSPDARSWTRGNQIDTITGTEAGYFAQLSEGIYFNYLDQQWWLGQIHPEVSDNVIGDNRILIIAKSDTPYNTLTQKEILNSGKENIRHSVYIDGDTAHIYITNPVSKMYHGTYDLTLLQDYL